MINTDGTTGLISGILSGVLSGGISSALLQSKLGGIMAIGSTLANLIPGTLASITNGIKVGTNSNFQNGYNPLPEEQ